MVEKLKEAREKKKTANDMYQDYYKDVHDYLKSRFPDILEWEIQETATFATHRMIICAGDILREHDREWQYMIKKYYEPKQQKVKRSEMHYVPRREHENSEL